MIFGIKLNVNALFCKAFPEFLICTSMPYLTPAIRPELAPILQTIWLTLFEITGHV